MKFSRTSFSLVFSLVAFLIAAGVLVLLWFNAEGVKRAEKEWYRNRTRKSVLMELQRVVLEQRTGESWLEQLGRFQEDYGHDVCATFTVGQREGPVWRWSTLPRSAQVAMRGPLDTLIHGEKIEKGVRVLSDVEPIELDGRPYLVVWLKLRPSHWERFGDIRVIGCVVRSHWSASRTQRLADVLFVGLMLVSFGVVWQLVLSARRTRREAALKTQFVANYAHELKTPLASLLLRAEMLREGRYSSEEKRVRALDVIVTEGRRLNGMVLNLLDLIRIECRQMSFARESFDLAEMVRSVSETMRPFFAANGLEVRAVKPLLVRADAVRAREVLENLLSNASKYAAAEGTVEVEATCEDGWAVLRVLDRGPGLTPEQIKYVFDEYWRAEDSLTRETSGSGIGLFISREYARGMGGRLSVETRAGGGCVFTFALPLDTKVEETGHV